MRSTLIVLFLLSCTAIAGGFAAPVIAVHLAQSISPIFGGSP